MREKNVHTRLGTVTLALLGVLVLPILSRSTEPNKQSSAPSIYYYSPSESAFVVEGADGSHHAILAQYQLPSRSSPLGIGGPGWSPSGQWFAWTITDLEGGNPPESVANIVNRETGEILSLVDSLNNRALGDIVMHWSPIEDLLLVFDGLSKTFLFDARSQKVVTVFDVTHEPELIRWAPNGQSVIFYDSDFSSPNEPVFKMYVIGLDGKRQERHLHLVSDCYREILPFWSAGTKVAYLNADDGTLVIEDFTTGDKTSQEVSQGVLRFVDWSPDGNHALVYTASSCEAKSLQVDLLSLNDQTFTSLLQGATLPESYVTGRFDDWFNHYTLYPISGWSPSGDKAVIFSSDNDLYALALSPYSLQKISIPLIGKTNFVHWVNNSDRCLFERDPIEPQKQAEIFSYDFQTQVLDPFLESSETDNISFLALSPNGHFLAYSYLYGYLVDLTTGDTNQIEFLSSVLPEGGRIDEVIWHPSEDWLFILYQAPSTRLVNVVDSEGNIQRELGECTVSPSCFGWLPTMTD